MTRQEAKRIIEGGLMCGAKYKRGYCCYQDDHIPKSELVELGYNSGVYGWNWTLYHYPPTDTYYLSDYRNAPTIRYPENYGNRCNTIES